VSDVFISYAREDRQFAQLLTERLEISGRTAWVDWDGIPPTADWMEEIHRAIDAADSFILIISPDSVKSNVCRAECEYAASSEKRIVPVLHHQTETHLIPPLIQALNWIFFRAGDDPARAFMTLESALDLDLPWVRFHTRLVVRASEWQAHAKDVSYLLSGSDLEEAQVWIEGSLNQKPHLSSLQTAYITAGQHETLVRHRRQLRGFYLASIIYSALLTVVTYLLAFDEFSETALMILSPLWVLGMAFGGSGLLMRRPTLKKAGIVSAVAAAALYIFFVTVWPIL